MEIRINQKRVKKGKGTEKPQGHTQYLLQTCICLVQGSMATSLIDPRERRPPSSTTSYPHQQC